MDFAIQPPPTIYSIPLLYFMYQLYFFNEQRSMNDLIFSMLDPSK